MKKYVVLIFLILFIFLCSSCSNEKEIEETLPSFDPIDANDKTIYLESINNYPKKIYAVDTEKERVIYTYILNTGTEAFAYDPSFDINPYMIFIPTTLPGFTRSLKALKLDVRSGKLKKVHPEIKLEHLAMLTIIDNKLLVKSFDNYIIYDPKTNALSHRTIPEGSFSGEREHCTFINWKYYILISSGYYENYKIYNLTDSRIVSDNLFDNLYSLYRLSDHYLQGIVSGPPGKFHDTYYVRSFEPLDCDLIFSEPYSMLLTTYEKENFVYFLETISLTLKITKRDKNNGYSIVKSLFFNDSGDGITYCIDGYIWVFSENNNGAYKINMDDLSYTVIK